MSPDLLFALSLATKMVVSAAFVVMASIVAEKAGPLIGAMVSTLPIGSGPAYIFLALDHDVYFLEASTVASLAIHAASGVFGMVYVMLAQRRSLLVSMGGALVAWTVCASAIREITWTISTAALLNAVVYAICIPLARRYLHVMMPPIRRRWFDIPLRALLVAALVGGVVEASATVGPKLTGILAVFPIVMTSLMLIMHPRIGGPASAAIIANTMWGLVGFATRCWRCISPWCRSARRSGSQSRCWWRSPPTARSSGSAAAATPAAWGRWAGRRRGEQRNRPVPSTPEKQIGNWTNS